MNCSLEPTGAILRVHEEGGYGSPFSLSLYITFIDKVAYISGAMRAPTASEWRAILDRLWLEGVETVMYKRVKNGVEVYKKIKKGHYAP